MATEVGLRSYYVSKIEEMELNVRDKVQNLERLQAQRNELNAKVRQMREELSQVSLIIILFYNTQFKYLF